jgi:hypothetical protein
MARLSTLADAHPQSAGIRVKVVDDHDRQLAVAAAGQQGRSDQRAEIGWARISQPAGLSI